MTHRLLLLLLLLGGCSETPEMQPQDSMPVQYCSIHECIWPYFMTDEFSQRTLFDDIDLTSP